MGAFQRLNGAAVIAAAPVAPFFHAGSVDPAFEAGVPAPNVPVGTS